jgi:hypothetical protein
VILLHRARQRSEQSGLKGNFDQPTTQLTITSVSWKELFCEIRCDWRRDFADSVRNWMPIATIWWGEQSEAELQAEIAEREAKGFRVVVVSWER